MQAQNGRLSKLLSYLTTAGHEKFKNVGDSSALSTKTQSLENGVKQGKCMFELAYYHCQDSSLISIATNPRASLQSNHLNIDSWAVRSRNNVLSSWPR